MRARHVRVASTRTWRPNPAARLALPATSAQAERRHTAAVWQALTRGRQHPAARAARRDNTKGRRNSRAAPRAPEGSTRTRRPSPAARPAPPASTARTERRPTPLAVWFVFLQKPSGRLLKTSPSFQPFLHTAGLLLVCLGKHVRGLPWRVLPRGGGADFLRWVPCGNEAPCCRPWEHSAASPKLKPTSYFLFPGHVHTLLGLLLP